MDVAVSQGCGDATLTAWKMKEGTRSQGTQVASGSWKRQTRDEWALFEAAWLVIGARAVKRN